MHGVPFRFVWSALAWPCMAAAHLVSVGKFRHVAIMKAALAWPTLLRVPGGRTLHLSRRARS